MRQRRPHDHDAWLSALAELVDRRPELADIGYAPFLREIYG